MLIWLWDESLPLHLFDTHNFLDVGTAQRFYAELSKCSVKWFGIIFCPKSFEMTRFQLLSEIVKNSLTISSEQLALCPPPPHRSGSVVFSCPLQVLPAPCSSPPPLLPPTVPTYNNNNNNNNPFYFYSAFTKAQRHLPSMAETQGKRPQ